MRRTCSALPTSRARPATIAAMGKGAANAAGEFGAWVRLPIPNSSDDAAFTGHAGTVGELLPAPNGYERVRLPPASGTVGGDHYLLGVVRHAALIGVALNRLVVEHRTPKRRSGSGFVTHQVRLTKLLPSMLYFHPVRGEVTGIGGNPPGGLHRVHADAIGERGAGGDRARSVRRLGVLDASCRRSGGRYAGFADRPSLPRECLLGEARADEEGARPLRAKGALGEAARTVGGTASTDGDVGFRLPAGDAGDAWDAAVALAYDTYRADGPSEGREALRAEGRPSPGDRFAMEHPGRVRDFLLGLPYSLRRCPDLGEAEEAAAGARSTPAGPRRGSPTSPAASSAVAQQAGQNRRPGPHSSLNRQLL
nr:DUF6271 family protein [Streptomyces sp. SID3343]